MRMAHGECGLISIRCHKECFKSKLDGQTDSNSDFSMYLRFVLTFGTKSLKYCLLGLLLCGFNVREHLKAQSAVVLA